MEGEHNELQQGVPPMAAIGATVTASAIPATAAAPAGSDVTVAATAVSFECDLSSEEQLHHFEQAPYSDFSSPSLSSLMLKREGNSHHSLHAFCL